MTPLAPSASADPMRPASGQICSVQSLRAIAALFVVIFHSTVLWHDKFTPSIVPWTNGNSGVDLFFVISGFIMVLSSRRLQGKPNGWSQFLVLRLVRIVPMYWLATAAKLVAVAAVPALALHTHPTEWNSVASFLFLPARDAVGAVRPPLAIGWTLSFEMLFYLVFASALFLRVAPLRVVGPIMAVLALLSVFRTENSPAITTLASPIVLEFVFGVLVGRAVLSGMLQRFSSPWTVVVSAVGLSCLVFVPIGDAWSRAAIWGLAASATLAGCVLAERWLDRFLPRLLVKIGEASYSLYLTHGFVLPVVGLALAKSGLTGGALGGALIASCVIASTVVALVSYRFVEAPITSRLRLLVGDGRRVSLAAPQSAI